eukprot:CAMPEP_0119111448 /NCGR_PEP_ID=MMETSP1180-20130426/35662_1 /TAXON_ID=3052 ORGANISM="Chlamydomonas cf sp, Strain CCMP681" /NCGR_SAMPLE_ID=MMETSP1180 /ASSEMBLY_ACC=CAM_ASM_000741 /LENGTH=32 /DNA_ID= /DNA_START= /DNA_END= /DNA_ORIENTATION=
MTSRSCASWSKPSGLPTSSEPCACPSDSLSSS